MAAPALRRPGWFHWLTAGLLLVSGLAMALPGGFLVSLGGSAYYLVTGLTLLLCAVLIVQRQRAAVPLFGLLLLATAGWSLWEIGFDGWALMPRLVFLAVAGLWLLIWAAFADLRPISAPAKRGFVRVGAVLGAAVLALGVLAYTTAAPALPPAGPAALPGVVTADGEWPHYGGTLAANRHSPLDEITPANAGGLRQAWVFRTGMAPPPGRRGGGGLQMTALMVDGRVYGCTAFNSVFALDPVTGKQLWRHDPVIAKDGGGHAVCRGVAFFRAPAGTADCPVRLLVGLVDNRLIALDARTGQPCRSFGRDGAIDLRQGLGEYPRRWTHPTSPATIVGGTAVIGAYVADNQSSDAPPGVVRGYDAVTGQLKWAFDPGRPETTAAAPQGTYTPSTPNSWTLASGDEALGLVYVPMGNGSPDFFGGNRSAQTERFSTALVALDAQTGAVRWTFQTVHHDLWDYDLAAQPVLIDVTQAGRRIPALILATKTGQLFVLDRRTGTPLTRVEERSVPASTLPGERSAPTQPFSVGMPDFAGDRLREADMWGLTPFDQLYCRIRFRQARYQGMFTPPGLEPTIRYPGELGGIDWGSVAFDPGRRILIVNSNHMADYDQLISRAQAVKEGIIAKRSPDTHSAPGGAMEGTPYAVRWGPFLSFLDVPCQRPPFGRLTAIDVDTQKLRWSQPIGDARNSGPLGFPLGLNLPLGAPNIGGALTTAGGVTFIGATQDEMFRAFDTASGKLVWQAALPVGAHATPMAYRAADGHQYVLVAAGGKALKDKPGDYLIAFRLDSARR